MKKDKGKKRIDVFFYFYFRRAPK